MTTVELWFVSLIIAAHKTRMLAGAVIACAIRFPRLMAAVPACGSACCSARPLQRPNPAECANLTTLKLTDAKVTESAPVAAAATGTVKVPHCRVAGVIGTEIKFSLLMPDAWNHKFLMGGGGGFVGTIDNQALSMVNAGYATVGTDTGHQGRSSTPSWALNNDERQVNFGYLAVHRTAETAKAIIRSYYGSPQTRAYFSGCSNGGRQALMEAQRYPDDFDGIVAGAPAADFTGIGAQFIKDVRRAVPRSENLTPLFSPEVLQSVASQVARQMRCARRREGRRDGGSAAVQGGRWHVDWTDAAQQASR